MLTPHGTDEPSRESSSVSPTCGRCDGVANKSKQSTERLVTIRALDASWALLSATAGLEGPRGPEVRTGLAQPSPVGARAPHMKASPTRAAKPRLATANR